MAKEKILYVLLFEPHTLEYYISEYYAYELTLASHKSTNELVAVLPDGKIQPLFRVFLTTEAARIYQKYAFFDYTTPYEDYIISIIQKARRTKEKREKLKSKIRRFMTWLKSNQY